jgi:hypothetical protein
MEEDRMAVLENKVAQLTKDIELIKNQLGVGTHSTIELPPPTTTLPFEKPQ